MLYRVEFYVELNDEWVGMFRGSYLTNQLVQKMASSDTFRDFSHNLPDLDSASYDQGIRGSCHCYFTDKGYKKFKRSILKWIEMLNKEVKTRLVEVEENEYSKLYTEDFQAVLLDN